MLQIDAHRGTARARLTGLAEHLDAATGKQAIIWRMTSADDPQEMDLLVEAQQLCSMADSLFAKFAERAGSERETEGSPAWNTRIRTGREVGPGGAWPTELVDNLTSRTNVYRLICLQHFAAIEILLANRPFGLSLGPLVRSVVEACGRAIWLTDPTLLLDDVRSRVARVLLDEVDDLARFRKIASSLGHGSAADLGRQWRAARDNIAKPKLFREEDEIVKDERTGDIVLRGQRFPGTSDAVGLAEKFLHPERQVAAATYNYLSSMTHPSVTSYSETMAKLPGEPVRIALREDPIFPAKITVHAISSFTDAWRLYASWLGVGTLEADVLVEKANQLQAEISALRP